MKSYRVASLMLAMALALGACNFPSARPTEQINPNAVFTAAAQTVEVQLTQNSLTNPTNAPATQAPPTNTPPILTNTPVPQSVGTTTPPAPAATTGPVVKPTTACDSAQFVNDVSVPDGTIFPAGTTFTKSWRIKNVGTCTWNSSYSLVFDSGDAMGGATSQPLIGTVAPNESIDIAINLQAPAQNGTFRGYWGLSNGSGVRLPMAGGTNGKSFYVEIKVGTGVGSGGTESPGKFAVTSVGFSASRSGDCSSAAGKYIVTATITTNKAGEVTYTWIRSDGASGPENNGTLTFNNAGSQAVSFEWITTQSNLWVELYVDKPNHQQFGRATLNCP